MTSELDTYQGAGTQERKRKSRTLLRENDVDHALGIPLDASTLAGSEVLLKA